MPYTLDWNLRHTTAPPPDATLTEIASLLEAEAARFRELAAAASVEIIENDGRGELTLATTDQRIAKDYGFRRR